ncbi:MAG: hypothetical protein DME22_20215 [Verrucomicrobia bacterium]|nr:MAG: hypothetical protein DME22_20215 [Verrucomicrobiota bacterium]
MVGTLYLEGLSQSEMKMKFVKLLGKLLQRREVILHGMILALLSSGPVVRAALRVTLAWDPSSDKNVVGYILHNGVVDTSYIDHTDVGNTTSATLTNVLEGVANFFFVTGYDSKSIESVPSNLIGTNCPGTYPLPTISAIPDYQIGENSSAGPIILTNGDDSFIPASLDDLYIFGTSSNPTLVPDGNILFGGSDSNRTMTVVPAINEVGSAIITYTASDGTTNASRSFLLTVTPTLPSRLVYLKVEAGSATLVPPMTAFPDASASGGQFIATSDAGSGTATFTVDIPVSGVYLILCRVRSPDKPEASFVVSADDAALDILDASQGTWTDDWRWTIVNWPGGFKVSDSNGSTNSQTVFPFTVGQHRITFWGLEPDIGLDEILITNDRNSIRIRPILSVPPDQSINELTTLVVTNTATDTNILANALSFSLVAAPTGVNLHPDTGVLTWTPTEAQGPSTNLITVRVTDDGSTPLSDTRSFTVVVNEVNSPPELMPVPDLTIRPGSRLIMTNRAYDPDIPPNILTFSLGIGAPVGAAIDASNGVFTWQPTAAQADSTNAVTVWVTDDGSPPLSHSTTFRVIVPRLSPITLASLSLTNQQFRLGVSADSGISYSLQASTNLESWISLTTVNAADADFELVDTNAAAFPYRFYRVVVGP